MITKKHIKTRTAQLGDETQVIAELALGVCIILHKRELYKSDAAEHAKEELKRRIMHHIYGEVRHQAVLVLQELKRLPPSPFSYGMDDLKKIEELLSPILHAGE